MKLITIDKLYFASSVNSLENAVQGINFDKKDYGKGNERSIALEEYARLYDKLQFVMQCYQQLLLKDAENIKVLEKEFDNMDSILANIWNIMSGK